MARYLGIFQDQVNLSQPILIKESSEGDSPSMGFIRKNW